MRKWKQIPKKCGIPSIRDKKQQLKRLELFGEGCRTTVNNIMETKGEEFYRWNMPSLLICYIDFNFISTKWPYYSLDLFISK